MRGVALLLLAAAPVAAQEAPGPVVVSAGPAATAVTVYRDPDRDDNGTMNLRNLAGYALVTETRRVTLPKGRATLRFEGVAGGIIPVSAVIDGLPGGTIEKNRDAQLLSPAALVDGTLGNRVTLRRTDRASGRTVEEDATIVAGPAGGVVLRTSRGFEALGCAGLAESMRYPRVPVGLSAKPVLSVVTDSPVARTVTARLSYLATGFDWSASYVATMATDGRSVDVFAWTTLANGNAEGFSDAQVQVVAGRLNRQWVDRFQPAAARLELRCYPLGTTTSDLPTERFDPANEIFFRAREDNDIVVTGMRFHAPLPLAAPPPPPPAEAPPPEDLGDVKLYRVPTPTTVAANSQKQVALLRQKGVPFARIYRRRVNPGQTLEGGATDIALRVVNTTEKGLGVALPSGTTALYAPRDDTQLLIGTGTLTDRAAGETLLIAAGTSRQVQVAQTRTAGDGPIRLTVTNARPVPVAVELPIGNAGMRIKGKGLVRIDGVMTWRTTVPANGTATLTYRVR
jgi:hypothetical protein